MRKLWILGAMVGTLFFAACGGGDKVYYDTRTTTTTSVNGVPNNVVRKFYNMYPSADNVTWKMDDGLYKADFDIAGEDMDAAFSSDGNYVEVDM